MKTGLTAFVLTVLGCIAHQAAHGLAGQSLGYQMELTALTAVPLGGYAERAHGLLINMAGPLATLAIALVAAIGARFGGSLTLLWLTLTSLAQRVASQALVFPGADDEMQVSQELGIGAWTLPAAVAALLLLFTLWAARGAKPSVAQVAFALLGSAAGLAGVVFGEPYLPSIRF